MAIKNRKSRWKVLSVQVSEYFTSDNTNCLVHFNSVGLKDGSLQAHLQSKLVGLVRWLAVTSCCPAFIG